MTTARHGKGAPIDHTYYSSQAVLRCFESICEPLESELHKHSPGFHVDSKELATLIAQLQQFQQDYLGLDCPDPPSPCPLRIPAKLFKIIPNQPLTKNSPLYSICLAASTFRIINNKDHWDFAPSLKNKNAEMIQFIRDFLQRATIMPLPRIGFADNMPDNARKTLTTVARKLQGASFCICIFNRKVVSTRLSLLFFFFSAHRRQPKACDTYPVWRSARIRQHRGRMVPDA